MCVGNPQPCKGCYRLIRRNTADYTLYLGRRVASQRPRDRPPALVERRAGQHQIHQADPPGLDGLDGGSGARQQQCPALSDERGQSLGAAPGRHDFQLHLIEGDLDVVGSHPDVGGDGDLGAAAKGVAVQRGDHRSGEAGKLIADRPHPLSHRRGILYGAQRAELLEVAAGHKSPLAGPRDHQG